MVDLVGSGDESMLNQIYSQINNHGPFVNGDREEEGKFAAATSVTDPGILDLASGDFEKPTVAIQVDGSGCIVHHLLVLPQ